LLDGLTLQICSCLRWFAGSGRLGGACLGQSHEDTAVLCLGLAKKASPSPDGAVQHISQKIRPALIATAFQLGNHLRDTQGVTSFAQKSNYNLGIGRGGDFWPLSARGSLGGWLSRGGFHNRGDLVHHTGTVLPTDYPKHVRRQPLEQLPCFPN